uniref:Non-structural protein 3a n=1 Tax=Porcine respiratory coronavirus TaxID=11146 RepID=Q9PX76_TGEV|nr:unknown [Porcine respiratory coronavirus]AAF02715.1 unknown [Porcine respiratory coronavirus]
MDIVKSINISVDVVLDKLDCAYFAVILKLEFKTGKLLVCIVFGDTLFAAMLSLVSPLLKK